MTDNNLNKDKTESLDKRQEKENLKKEKKLKKREKSKKAKKEKKKNPNSKGRVFFRKMASIPKTIKVKMTILFNDLKAYYRQHQALKLKQAEAQCNLQGIVEEAVESDDLLAGRIAYDQLYGKQNDNAKKAWRFLYFISFILLISIIINFALGSESKVDPIVVKVDGNNQILDVEQAAGIDYKSLSPEFNTYWIEQFVKNARGISIDGQYESSMIKTAYAFTKGGATKTLQTFIETRDPYATAAKEVITVQINSVIPNIGGSRNTTQVEWTEIAKDPKTQQVITEYEYTGQFTFAQAKKPPTKKDILEYNPFGFYVTNISWTQNFENH
jgi:type IV secretory pathway TrbF-like protein